MSYLFAHCVNQPVREKLKFNHIIKLHYLCHKKRLLTKYDWAGDAAKWICTSLANTRCSWFEKKKKRYYQRMLYTGGFDHVFLKAEQLDHTEF